MASTGTPPKGPERLAQRRRQLSDACQQQRQQATSSQVGSSVVSVTAAAVAGLHTYSSMWCLKT